MPRLLLILIHLMLIRPFVFAFLRPRIANRDRLPCSGPAIVVANHNSHLDTLVLMSLVPLSLAPRIRPLACARHFRSGWLVRWLVFGLLRAIPVDRGGSPRGHRQTLAACAAAIDSGDILIVYPEGTRGEPERLGTLQAGTAHLMARHRDVPIVPVLLKGLGRSLPKGSAVPKPVSCRVAVGTPLAWSGDRRAVLPALERRFADLDATLGRSRLAPGLVASTTGRPAYAP